MTTRSRSRRKPRTRGPELCCVATLLLVAVAVSIGAVTEYARVQRSDYTQHHGVRDTAQIGQVTISSSSNARGGGVDYSYVASADLEVPVDGHLVTEVHGQGENGPLEGEVLTVMVDPRDPTYAERIGAHWTARTPGSPLRSPPSSCFSSRRRGSSNCGKSPGGLGLLKL